MSGNPHVSSITDLNIYSTSTSGDFQAMSLTKSICQRILHFVNSSLLGVIEFFHCCLQHQVDKKISAGNFIIFLFLSTGGSQIFEK